jgi:hypothetical protein
LQAGTWFRWDPTQGQYVEPTELKPGVGYWVFATGSGTLDLSGGSSQTATTARASAQSTKSTSTGEDPEGALTLRVTDEAGHSREVYLASELTEEERRRWRVPPVGPGDAFAARFTGGFQAAAVGEGRSSSEAILKVQDAEGAARLRLQVLEEQGLQEPGGGKDGEEVRRIVQVKDASTGGERVEARLTAEAPATTLPAQVERLAVSVVRAPEEIALQGAYPNPARGQATLEFAIPERRAVQIAFYDVLGRWVATVVDGKKVAGRHEVEVDLSGFSSGTYFLRMRSGDFAATRRLTVVK